MPTTNRPDERYDTLLGEVTTYQQAITKTPPADNARLLLEFLHYLSSLQARAGAIVGEASLLKGQRESEFINANLDDFHKLPPTKFSMLMNAELYRYKALCVAADRLESDITHIADNLRTQISYLKGEAKLAPNQYT